MSSLEACGAVGIRLAKRNWETMFLGLTEERVWTTGEECMGKTKMFLRGLSLAVLWLRLHLPMQRVRVRSLTGELRTHMSHGQKTKHIKQKQYCNKFNRNFKKNCPHFCPPQKIYLKTSSETHKTPQSVEPALYVGHAWLSLLLKV